MSQDELQGDTASLGVGHHRGTLDFERIEDGGGVVTELRVGQRTRRGRAAAVLFLIDHGPVGDEAGHPLRHRVDGQEGTRDAQQRHPARITEVAVHLVGELEAVDREMTAACRLGPARRGQAQNRQRVEPGASSAVPTAVAVRGVTW